MHEQAGSRRQVDLFNFSFLDILACVIGLLIFILTIVVVSGGGSKTAQGAYAVAAADHELQDQRFVAHLASERRAKLEELLDQRASDAVDPVGAARSVQGETELLRNQAKQLVAARARGQQDLAAMQQELQNVERAAAVSAAAVGALTESQQLDAQTEEFKSKADRIRQQNVKTETVTYYIPRMRETQRFPVWLEIAGDRLWSLKSPSYTQIPLPDRAVMYRRLPDAEGIRVGKDDTVLSSEATASFDPGTTVLSVVVRPDGYVAFRTLREQAREKGYAINWIPLTADEPIVLVPAHNAYEQ
jgi:hypothetical protein